MVFNSQTFFDIIIYYYYQYCITRLLECRSAIPPLIAYKICPFYISDESAERKTKCVFLPWFI